MSFHLYHAKHDIADLISTLKSPVLAIGEFDK